MHFLKRAIYFDNLVKLGEQVKDLSQNPQSSRVRLLSMRLPPHKRPWPSLLALPFGLRYRIQNALLIKITLALSSTLKFY